MNNDSKPWLIVQKNGVAKLPTMQCDCACAESSDFIQTIDSLKNLVKPTGPFTVNSNLSMISLANGHYAAIGVNSDFSVLNPAAYRLWSNFKSLNSYPARPEDEKPILDMVDARLLLSGVDTFETIKTKSSLSAWIHITDRCNLRCEYCYLPHDKVDMSITVAKASVDSIIRSAISESITRVKIKIAGGEPLLNFKLVHDIILYARKAALDNSIVMDIVILTNGTLLTLPIAHLIKSLKARVMISLDGLDEFNDCQRKQINGEGTFKKIEAALDILQTLEIDIDISITVTGKNASGLAALCNYLLERDLFFGLSFYRENNLAKNVEELKLETNKIIKGILSAYKVLEERLPNYNLLGSLADRADLSSPHNYTCSASRNYLVFTPEGNISQCQMQLDKPVTNVETILPLKKIRTDTQLINLSVDEKEGCKTCEWKNWCAGGCPLETHRVTGRYDIKSPNCEIYKAIFPEVVRLEALRMMKYDI